MASSFSTAGRPNGSSISSMPLSIHEREERVLIAAEMWRAKVYPSLVRAATEEEEELRHAVDQLTPPKPHDPRD